MNDLINRLLNSINPDILNKFDQDLLEQQKFVPINLKDNFLFVIVNSFSDKGVINELLKKYYSEQVKFI